MTLRASFDPSGGGAIVGLGMTEVTRECSYSATGLTVIAIGCLPGSTGRARRRRWGWR